jgi:hypothetical protein
VKTTCEWPALFSAVAIEEVIDILVDLRLTEAQDMEENRQEILSYWLTMIRKDSTQQSL